MGNYTRTELEQALSRCESEPIKQIGQIQPHGLLLVLSADRPRSILQASENTAYFLGLNIVSVTGETLSSLIGSTAAEKIEQLILNAGEDTASGMLKIPSEDGWAKFQARVYPSGELYVVEMEYSEDIQQNSQRIDEMVWLQQDLIRAEAQENQSHYFDHVAAIIRMLTGFDRVMVYRFDTNWDGEVIAESRIDSAESYLDLRFPASDIPPQARQLYSINPVRYVADIGAIPVPIVPVINPCTAQPLDMSLSALRSFSPIHIEYLRNMGVQASLSISLLQNGRLWGLIACHHRTAKPISFTIREMATFVSRMISNRLSSLDSQQQHSLKSQTMHIIEELLVHITGDDEQTILNRFFPDLMALLDASGILVQIEGKRYSSGEIPPGELINDLLDRISLHTDSDVFSCDHLAEQFEPAKTYADIASGVLATPVIADMRNCILWFRKEKLRTINWAGNLDKLTLLDGNGTLRLCPRRSFQIWTELWHGRSTPWDSSKLECAKILSRALIESLIRKRLQNQALESQRQANENMDRFFRMSQDLMCIADRNGNFLRLNRIWESTLGYRLNELEGANCLDYIHPEDLEATLSIRKILLTGSELQGFINRYRCKNGSYRWLEWHSTLYQSNLVFSVARDITERLQKDELRLAEILKQRDALVREVHHRIKNNLQGVVGLLRLYAAEHTTLKDIIEVVIGRIFSIAVIHGLQAGSASEEVDLSRLVEHITQTSVPDLEIENNLSFPVLINRDDAVSVALALNELLTNAIKHRNPEMPIKISLDEVESAIHFHISNAKNTKPITAPRKGNGLHLVKSILPPKSARFKISETENTFGARLILSPPTIIMQKNGLSGSKNSD